MILDLSAPSPVASCVRRSAKCELTAKGGLGEGRGVVLMIMLLGLRVGLRYRFIKLNVYKKSSTFCVYSCCMIFFLRVSLLLIVNGVLKNNSCRPVSVFS